jgi:hypothetical protein
MRLTPLFLALALLCTTSITLAATVGDQVELNATHPAGVPFHNAPGGGSTFQRVPSGILATIIALERGGR